MAEKNLSFAEALKMFVEATSNSMKYAEICAMMAIRHFADHGNLVYCQLFMDAMPANYIRRVAFQKWLAAHAPVTIEKNKLLKDTSADAIELNLDGAEKEPFWEFAPDTEVLNFGPDDVMAALKAIVKKFENPKRFKAKDELATASVVSLKNYLETKAPKPAGNVPDETIRYDNDNELSEDGGSGETSVAERLAATEDTSSFNDAGDSVVEATA